jgi:heme/copper-type cytochrome/quinol oxidase subunit 2
MRYDMNAQTLTIISGVVLLVVFALVGWNLRRYRSRDDESSGKKQPGS